MRRAAVLTLLAALALGLGGPPSPADAGQTVALQTGFEPDRLGARTTIEFVVEISSTTAGAVPEPLTGVDLELPAGLDLTTSTLGLANCEAAQLLAGGLEGCPPNARVGFGTVTAAIPLAGREPVEEEGDMTILIGSPDPEHLEALFFANAVQPVSAQLIFPGDLLEASSPFGFRLSTKVPPIPTWPNGPDISITKIASTLGPLGLTYYRDVEGKVVPFHPRGVALPEHCPRDGFQFHVELTFADGSRAGAASDVPCPRRQP